MEGDTRKEAYTVEVEIDNETDHRVSEIWKMNGEIHREFGPAVCLFSEIDGALFLERWMINGQGHRDGDQPQEIIWDSDTGKILNVTYMANGLIHREGDKPAKISYKMNSGEIVREEYFKNGKHHRDKGPAIIVYDTEMGEIAWFLHYKNGFRLSVPGNSPNSP